VLNAVGENPHILPLAPIRDRQQMAAMFASADFLIHGAASETFGMVQAEALASGLPIIVPDEGAAVDHVRPGAGLTYATGDAADCAAVILRAIAARPAMHAAARAESTRVRTMDEHFDDLYGAYQAILDSGARAVA
jgi:alpha-1,6-mannosyltransferase